MSETEMK